MGEYPRTLSEFEARFATEEACRAYLASLRWPDGFLCPRCSGNEAWEAARGRLVCRACGRHVSVTAGTLFQDTHLPLTLWFRAIWWVVSQKNGASALGIQRVLGLGSYKTAWTWLHKLRRAMVRPGRDRLHGCVEVDEAYVGGEEPGVRGRKTRAKSLICVAAEEDGDRVGRIRMRHIRSTSRAVLHAFVTEAVEPGSTVRTDGLETYDGLNAKGYTHKATPLRGRKGSELLPRVHTAVSLLKRWLSGTHQDGFSHDHLDYYLDEFTFRFNRRTSQYRGKLFYRLLQNAVAIAPAPFAQIAKGVRGRGHRHKR